MGWRYFRIIHSSSDLLGRGSSSSFSSSSSVSPTPTSSADNKIETKSWMILFGLSSHHLGRCLVGWSKFFSMSFSIITSDFCIIFILPFLPALPSLVVVVGTVVDITRANVVVADGEEGDGWGETTWRAGEKSSGSETATARPASPSPRTHQYQPDWLGSTPWGRPVSECAISLEISSVMVYQ